MIMYNVIRTPSWQQSRDLTRIHFEDQVYTILFRSKTKFSASRPSSIWQSLKDLSQVLLEVQHRLCSKN